MEEGGCSKSSCQKDVREKADLRWRNSNRSEKRGGALAGKLMSVRSIHKPTVMKMIRKGWNLEVQDDMEIIEVGSHEFIFKFRRREDYLRILRGRPWSIQGILLNLQIWRNFMIFREVDFSLSPFWIQFHDIPLEALDVENAITIGSEFGKVMMVENPRKGELLSRNFLRARIVVDIANPFVKGIWTEKPDTWEEIWIRAQYERLQDFCYYCGKLGHDRRNCQEGRNVEDKERLRYGSWLSIQPARNIEAEIICCEKGWEEMEGRYGRNKGKEKENKVVLENQIPESVMVGKKTISSEKAREKRMEAEDKRSDSKKISEGIDRYGENWREGEEKTMNSAPQSKDVSPDKTEMLSKALVIHEALSPISKMTYEVGRMRLKRGIEEETDRGNWKKRRLCFDNKNMESREENKSGLKTEARRSIRILKRS